MNSKTNGYDRNYLLDLAISIMHDGADEWHAVEEINFLSQQLKNVSPDLEEVIKQYKEQLAIAKQELIEDARLRQAKTDYLAAKSPNWTYKRRCRVKHTGVAACTMLETYVADPTEEAFELACRSLQKFFRELARAMGMDVKDCGRCLNDSLNGVADSEQ
ncbi:MAG: hypothetical protein NC218_03870 [Acetobacter sp.]|nr:hypothetical protein [Acetobacter sp.]